MHFNPGELKEDIDVLELQNFNTVYSWVPVNQIRAKAEPQTKRNMFSRVGIGMESIKFTIRKQDVSLENAFVWRGKHCFLTNIDEINRLYYEVTAALIEPSVCVVKRIPDSQAVALDDLNRPKKPIPETVMTFPGYLTEKYLGFYQQVPQSQTETDYVLVTPKVIKLKIADIVEIGGAPYIAKIAHELDEYQNEYEIRAKKDV